MCLGWSQANHYNNRACKLYYRVELRVGHIITHSPQTAKIFLTFFIFLRQMGHMPASSNILHDQDILDQSLVVHFWIWWKLLTSRQRHNHFNEFVITLPCPTCKAHGTVSTRKKETIPRSITTDGAELLGVVDFPIFKQLWSCRRLLFNIFLIMGNRFIGWS